MHRWNLISRKSSIFAIAYVMSLSVHASTIKVSAQLTQEWDANFYNFPVEGTGSTAIGLLSFSYDTELNLVHDLNIQVSGISVADLRRVPNGAAHIHPSQTGSRVLDVGALGFVDVPGGIQITNGSATISEENELFLLSGQSWINIHTDNFPDGEIAGVVNLLSSPGFNIPIPVFYFPILMVSLVVVYRCYVSSFKKLNK